MQRNIYESPLLSIEISKKSSFQQAICNRLNIGLVAQRPRTSCNMASRRSARENGASREKSPRISSHDNNNNSRGLPQHRADVEDGPSRGKMAKLTPRIKSEGESGRRGIHPLHFFKIIWSSTSTLSRAVNVLWPVVPAAIAVYYHYPEDEQHLLKFILAYIAMVPCANLIGFAGQELARKMPHMLGVLVETTSVPSHTFSFGKCIRD